MPSVKDTIYPNLLTRVSKQSLLANFTPNAADIAFAKENAKKRMMQQCLLVALKASQYLHYVPQLNEIPYSVIKFISSYSSEYVLKKSQLVDYQSSGSFRRHSRLIRTYLKINNDSKEREAFCISYGIPLAETKENLCDLINALIELLIKNQYELPAFSSLVKIARTCRAEANDNIYHLVCGTLDSKQKSSIDSLFKRDSNRQKTPWDRIKQEPDKPTLGNIQDFIGNLKWLKGKSEFLPDIAQLPICKKEQFRHEALSLHGSDMRSMRHIKRYALSVTLIKTQLTQALDDLVDIFIKLLSSIEQEARLEYQSDIYEDRNRTSDLILFLKSVLAKYKESLEICDPLERMKAIDDLVAKKSDNMLDLCEEHIALAEHDELPYVVKAYRKKRKLLHKLMEQLPVATISEQAPLLKFWGRLHCLYVSKTRISEPLELPIAFFKKLSKRWQKYIIANQTDLSQNICSLEIACLLSIGTQLKTFNCYIHGGQKYGDPNEQLIKWDDYDTLANEYSQLSGIPHDGSQLIRELKAELMETSIEIDNKFHDIEGVKIQGDELILQRAFTKYSSETLEPLRHAISQRMPKVSIIDVISDTVRWLNLENFFRPLSGHESKLTDIQFRLIVTVFCYGCNIGTQQAMDSIKGLSRKQIAWLNARFASVQTIEKALKKVTNIYSQMDLPKEWGDGSHASADGTHRPTYNSNILSEFHVRYRQKGAIGYYMVSDQYIALFSQFIACGAHESWYILDRISKNELAIKPSILHGDTHAQNYVVFGLAHLLGIKLMPRIRGIKNLKFYKPSSKTEYKNLGALFSGTIQWNVIEKSMPEMMRIVLSIKQGKITPSAILRRLNTFNQRNILYKGFHELGKAVRTIFLLRCISDIELRKTIHRETNKSEQFHSFSSWLFFGNGGVIRHNERFDQEKIIKYHHLVSSLVILFNSHHMSKILDKLKREGFPFSKEDIQHLSPYQKFGTNLYGQYHLDLEKVLEPIRKELKI